MAVDGSRQFVTPIGELPNAFRPRHQKVWPIWETREKLEQPWWIGFPKWFINGQLYVLARNGGTKLNAWETVEVPITAIAETDITKAVEVLASQIIVEVGTTTVTEDQFSDGLLQVTGGLGAGLTLALKGNAAGGGTAGDTIVVYTGHEFPIALDTTSDIKISTSKFRNLRKSTGAGEKVVGAPAVDVEPSEYFWLHKQGPGSAYAGASITGSTAANVELVADTGNDSGQLTPKTDALDGNQVVAHLIDPTATIADGSLMFVDYVC